MKTLQQIRKDLGLEPETYFLENEVSDLVQTARLRANLTQEQLAKALNTKQESISRLERGYLPSLTFLKKIADLLGYEIIVSFAKK